MSDIHTNRVRQPPPPNENVYVNTHINTDNKHNKTRKYKHM